MAYVVSDIASAVQDDLNDPSFSSSRILRYLNAAQRRIFNTHSFRFTEASVTSNFSINDTTLSQQSDYQSLIALRLTDPVNTDQHHSFDINNYLPHREFFERYPIPANNTAGTPSYWTEYGSLIYFNCPMDKAYTYTQRYYKVPTELTVDADVPSVPVAFRELLELFALYRSEKRRGNHDVAATYLQEFEDGLEAMQLRYNPVSDVGFHTMGNVRTPMSDGDYE